MNNRQFNAAQRAYDNMQPPGWDDDDAEYPIQEWDGVVIVTEADGETTREIPVAGQAWRDHHDDVEWDLDKESTAALVGIDWDAVCIKEQIHELISIPTWEMIRDDLDFSWCEDRYER